MAATLSSTLSPLDVDAIGALLPACLRCRRLRRKCDTELPRCRSCNKAGEECTFVDGVTKETVSRIHLQSLIDRLKWLRAAKDAGTSLQSPQDELIQTPQRISSPAPPRFAENSQACGATAELFDVLTPLSGPGVKMRFWGSSSVFALANQVIQHACLQGLLPGLDDSLYDCVANPLDQDIFDRQLAPASTKDVQDLIAHYMRTMNCIYTFLDEVAIQADLQAYLALRARENFSISDLKDIEAHQFFRISLICAIACATQARHLPSRVAESLGYYNEAISCVEAVTSEASSASLQALLLLIIFSLFYPRKGEIWRLLDYACRLAVQLGYHTERDLENPIPDEGFSTDQIPEGVPQDLHRWKTLRRSTFWALYALERIMGQLFGRGSDIPESIITIEYPSPSHYDRPAASAEAAADEHGRLQAAAFAHHYRLVYLRSEIFNAIYLPATETDHVLTHSWLRDRYADIRAWRKEVLVSDDFAGYATLTCFQGYNQTLCFLFQPLLLRALSSLQQNPSPTTTEAGDPTTHESSQNASSEECVVVVDSYEAACELLQAYKLIIREPLGSLLGSYPLTVLSAHYIWLAASTLIAHALLAIGGRVHKVWHFREWEETGNDVSKDVSELGNVIDYGSFIEMSRLSCTLLRWCADRWPGMTGLVEVYDVLFAKLIRELMMRGLLT